MCSSTRLVLLLSLFALAGEWSAARANPGDVENSRDYPGFTRLPGFLITDYDEDNPASFDFSVARPLAIDENNVETLHVTGHRYVIRYELGSGGTQPTLLEAQRAYEKQAVAAGYAVEKTGAVGDVTETFHQAKAGHDIWVCLEPSMTVEVLSIVESSSAAPPPQESSPPPAIAATPSVTEDALYVALLKNGHVALPLTFFPGKPDLNDDSQPVIDRVVAILKLHPDLVLRIEGHTDDTGDPQENERLSAQRAAAVREMLIASHIDKSRLTTVGCGGTQPVADNMTAEGREKNRRIELVLPEDSPLFHAPAPNGENYYPEASESTQ